MSTKVPPLAEMREMPDAELLALRTELSYDRGVIDGQLRFDDNDDQDWRRRAAYAQHIREHGMGTIKNILAERSALRDEDFIVPLERWLSVMYGVIEAARALFDADGPDDALWDALESALERYDDFAVKYSLVSRVVGS